MFFFLDADTSYPPPPPQIPCSIRHSLSLWRVLRLYLGSVLVHSLQTCTFMSTRKTLVPSRRAVSVRTWKTQSRQIMSSDLTPSTFWTKFESLRFKILGLSWAFFSICKSRFLILRRGKKKPSKAKLNRLPGHQIVHTKQHSDDLHVNKSETYELNCSRNTHGLKNRAKCWENVFRVLLSPWHLKK